MPMTTRISTTMPTDMPLDLGLLTLAQWLSPAYPIGAFAYSHGLELAAREGWISDADSLENWLRDCLTDGSGRADAIWLRGAFDAEDPGEIDARARAFAASAERLREGARQGAAFAEVTNAIWGLDLPPLMLPVAVGQAARRMALDPEATLLLYLNAFASNLVAAAQRLAPIGQTDGQRVLSALHPTCIDLVRATRGAGVETVNSSAFLSDIAAMRHETLDTRIFQS